MRVLCIGRHPYLSGHIGRFFAALGLDVIEAVGLEDALRRVAVSVPDVALCDYDLMTLRPMGAWHRDAHASTVPLIAVSLTRRPEEMLLEPGQVAGSLYLPVVTREDALALLRLAASRGGVALPAGAAYHAPGARLAPSMLATERLGT